MVILDNFIEFIYEDSQGNISERKVTNFIQDKTHIEGYCHSRKETRTFRRDKILKIIDSRYTGEEENYEISTKFFKQGKTASNEICFTGFKRARKSELISLAQENNFTVRADSTSYLDYLVCGYNAGPSKIEKAKKNGATIISEEEFIQLLKTGEVKQVA